MSEVLKGLFDFLSLLILRIVQLLATVKAYLYCCGRNKNTPLWASARYPCPCYSSHPSLPLSDKTDDDDDNDDDDKDYRKATLLLDKTDQAKNICGIFQNMQSLHCARIMECTTF